MGETITALATPPGVAGLSVIRVSGNEAISIVSKSFRGKNDLNDAKSHTIHYGSFYHIDILLDNVTVSVFRNPNSYTGEDVVEIGCHGGVLLYQEILNTLIENGCRLAEPGEFTRRAFLNGKLDLTQVEAVADIIHSQSVPGVLTAARQLKGNFTERLKYFRDNLINLASLLELELDFVEEDLIFAQKEEIREKIGNAISSCKELTEAYKASEILRSGYYVGIAGYPNSGKSTLFNTLLQRERAITSHIPGTTRDYIEETLLLNGISVKLIDTAGLRDTEDIIELEGIRLVNSVIEQSNMILVINDITISPYNSDKLLNSLKKKYPEKIIFLINNKIDKVTDNLNATNFEAVYISAKKNVGIEQLKQRIEKAALESTERVLDILINQRHAVLLKRATDELQGALQAVNDNFENEFIAIDIRRAIKTLGEITGESWDDEILNNIFSKFCIGK